VLEVALGVGVDHGRVDHRALRLAAGRVADARRVVAHDQDALVALVLEGSHPLERNAVPQRDVRSRHVDPELHPQRPAELQLLLEASLGQHVNGVTS
jgi:hypothetical protein